MTLREYLSGLLTIAKEHPEALDMVAIYSHDDEGNAYQQVIANGTLVEVENPEAHYVEIVWKEEKQTKPNAVIVN
jgi:nitroimidazol reductase NimA-like FMN-containing flavoprotein (pyridoxamine 5'-phosphate oxidase superfamily)